MMLIDMNLNPRIWTMNTGSVSIYGGLQQRVVSIALIVLLVATVESVAPRHTSAQSPSIKSSKRADITQPNSNESWTGLRGPNRDGWARPIGTNFVKQRM